MNRSKTALCALAATLALGGAAVAETPAAVKARQGQMNLYAFNLMTLGGMAQGSVAYDADTAQAAADNLVMLTSLNAGPLWAPGTATGEVEGTRALPALWEDMDDVIAKSIALGEAALAMQTAAGEGLDAIKSAMGPLGAACGDCHKAYREPQ